MIAETWNVATCIVNDPQFGWQAFSGNLEKTGDSVKIVPLDTARSRIYIAPLGLWLTLEAGTFEHVELNAKTQALRVGLAPTDSYISHARLRIEQPAKVNGVGTFHPEQSPTLERDAYVVALKSTETWIDIESK